MRAMSSLNDIRAAIQERLEFLRVQVEEARRLEAALEALGPEIKPAPKTRRRRATNAPYGYKADGTPRKRPGRPRKEESVPNGAAPETAVLHLTTGGVPAVKEGAEPAYITQEG